MKIKSYAHASFRVEGGGKVVVTVSNGVTS